MAEARMKAIPEFLKSGGAGYLGPGGISGMDMGADPNVTAQVINQANAAQNAKTFQAAMTGLNQGSQGGYQLADPSAAPGVPPGTSMTNLGPALTQAAKIRAAAQVASAGINAGGKGQPSASIVVRDPNTQLPVTLHIPRASPASVGSAANQWGVPNVDQPAPNAPPPGNALPGVPRAPGTTSAPPTTSAAPNNAAAGNAQLQASVKANLGRMPPSVQSDITAAAAKNNGQPIVGVDAQGPYALGASGTKHR
jgi:hypothetical protein